MKRYDHRAKAGNRGDVIKHPALVAALQGLLSGHEGPFRYADAFAGRWENDLAPGAGWEAGIAELAPRWRGGNPDVQLWREQWTAEPGTRYPGSAQLAQRVLAIRGSYEIRAFEIWGAYAAGLRRGLGGGAVFVRQATAADWAGWRPDLLFIDPPGLRSDHHPDYPDLESLLSCGGDLPGVLMWLPIISPPGGDSAGRSPRGADDMVPRRCAEAGFGVLSVTWGGGPLAGCRLACRFRGKTVEQRVRAAVCASVDTMGGGWRLE